MNWCEGCRALEGKVVEREVDSVLVCGECGEEITKIPEHDDSDMER